MAAGDVRAEPGDPDGAAGSAVDAVEVDRPVPVVGGAGGGAHELEVGDGLAALQYASERGGHPLGLGGCEVVVDGTASVLVDVAAEEGGEAAVGALHREVHPEQEEAEGRLAENRLRGGEVGLDLPEHPDVHHDAHRAAPPAGGLARHDVQLGDSVRVVLARHPERDQTRPLLAVEDLRDPAATASVQFGGHEGVHRILAHGIACGHAEELLGPAAPLLHQSVGPDGEGGDSDVVVDRAGRAALPHDVARRVRHPSSPRYLAHATVPSSSSTPDRPWTAVFSTTAPAGTVFTITARSQSLSDSRDA